MQFEFHTGGVMSDQLRQRQVFGAGQFHQSRVALATAPMILAIRRQQHIAKRQLRFREIASDKIRFRFAEIFSRQPFGGIQQTGTAIHQQPGRFVQRNFRRVAMLLATGEQHIIATLPAVAGHEIVVKHARRAAAQLVQCENFELHFKSGFRR